VQRLDGQPEHGTVLSASRYFLVGFVFTELAQQLDQVGFVFTKLALLHQLGLGSFLQKWLACIEVSRLGFTGYAFRGLTPGPACSLFVLTDRAKLQAKCGCTYPVRPGTNPAAG